MFQTGFIGMVGSLGAVSKIVLLVLFVFSVISWAIIFFKWRAFRVADREDKQFLALLAKTEDRSQAVRAGVARDGTPSVLSHVDQPAPSRSHPSPQVVRTLYDP